MKQKQKHRFIVQVPVTLWLEVNETDERLAALRAVEAYEWLVKATDWSGKPKAFKAFRVLAKFGKSSRVRGSLKVGADE